MLDGHLSHARLPGTSTKTALGCFWSTLCFIKTMIGLPHQARETHMGKAPKRDPDPIKLSTESNVTLPRSNNKTITSPDDRITPVLLQLLPFEEWFIKIYLRDATMCAPEDGAAAAADDGGGSYAGAAAAASLGNPLASSSHYGDSAGGGGE
eukprot:COSAG06_NODE_3693_length_4999_cov_204.219388_7_plen_152_part_00